MKYALKTISKTLLGVFLTLASLSESHGQGTVIGSSTIYGTEVGTTGSYDYTLTLTADSGSAPIESFWFAWTPGHFYLQSNPTSIAGNNGWTGTADSGSIQFTEGTAITPGNTETFTFVSTITPAQMSSDVGSASSVIYPGAINFSGSSPNETIGVQTVPEPSVAVLGTIGAIAMGLNSWRKWAFQFLDRSSPSS